MKKAVLLIVIIMCLACAGLAFAQKEVMVDRDKDGKTDGVDIYDDSERVVKRGYDTNRDMNVDRWETYDQNTGMPIVTQSDKAFELR